jgi:hypothetical protein
MGMVAAELAYKFDLFCLMFCYRMFTSKMEINNYFQENE